MGIPYFYGEVIAKSPLNKQYSIIADKLPKPCARFFLDFNSIIHPCSASVVAKLSKEATIDDKLYNNIFHAISEYTIKLVDIAQPSDLLYIAVDGVAPRAKMHQQRKRRYLSALRNKHIASFKEHHGIPHTKWDSNCITPGTDFMDKLDIFLDTDFRQTIQKQFPGIKNVIVSGTAEEGEGEHKMIRYMKETSDPNPKTDSIDVIYGLDADLIMLSMTCENNEIILMRESSDFGKFQSSNTVPFKYLVTSQFQEALLDVFQTTNSNVVYDYVFICYLLGNDFIPSLSFLKIKAGAVDIIMECYKQSCMHIQSPSHLINKSKEGMFTVDYKSLINFINALKEHENELMIEAIEHYTQALPKPQRNFNTIIVNKRKANPSMTLKEIQDQAIHEFSSDLEEFPLRNKFIFTHEINPKLDKKWRNSYYYYLFNTNTPETIKTSCKEYVYGLLWTVNYYFNLGSCSEWYYPYHFAPCVSDLHKYLHSIDEEEMNKQMIDLRGNDTIRNNANVQLLLVLPPQSINLLPPNLQSIMTDVTKGCVHFYPIDFEMQTYLKNKMWECNPIIPHIDKSKIMDHL